MTSRTNKEFAALVLVTILIILLVVYIAELFK